MLVRCPWRWTGSEWILVWSSFGVSYTLSVHQYITAQAQIWSNVKMIKLTCVFCDRVATCHRIYSWCWWWRACVHLYKSSIMDFISISCRLMYQNVFWLCMKLIILHASTKTIAVCRAMFTGRLASVHRMTGIHTSSHWIPLSKSTSTPTILISTCATSIHLTWDAVSRHDIS